MRRHPRLFPIPLVPFGLVLALAACSGGSTPAPDTSRPTVSSTDPVDGRAGVPTDAVLTVTFSEPVDAKTVDATTFTVTDSGGGVVAGTLAVAGATVTFKPDATLKHLTAYTATVTTGVEDLAGNPLAAEHPWRFTTVTTPTPLLAASTLKQWVDDGGVNGTGAARVVVLDVTTAAIYAAGHVPGAHLVLATEVSENRREGPAIDVTMVLAGAKMDALAQRLGIDGGTTVVFTGSNGTGTSILNATRAYWTFRYWGFPRERLKVLDGFNAAWSAAYGLVPDATPAPAASAYTVTTHAGLEAGLRASLSEMMEVAAGHVANAVILDARSAATAGSYSGATGKTAGVFAPAGDFVVFEGRMNGARALDYTTLYDATTLQFKAPDVLAAAFTAAGVGPAETTYVHCRTGVIASLPFFVLDAILGWPVANYDGSWSQWGQLSGEAAMGGQLPADSAWRTDDPALSEVVTYNHPAFAVEILTLDGGTCSGTLAVDGTVAYANGCTPGAPDLLASGNEVEVEDAAYMGH